MGCQATDHARCGQGLRRARVCRRPAQAQGYPAHRQARVCHKNGILHRSALDERTTRHPGYTISLRIRKRIEGVFGWIKTTGSLRQTRHGGTEKVDWAFTLTVAAYNLVRLPKLMAEGVPNPPQTGGLRKTGRKSLTRAGTMTLG
ncbi:transposase [Mesorhizobium caraganae]|nr:transposase [Mesorhizobium caraganae]